MYSERLQAARDMKYAMLKLKRHMPTMSVVEKRYTWSLINTWKIKMVKIIKSMTDHEKGKLMNEFKIL